MDAHTSAFDDLKNSDFDDLKNDSLFCDAVSIQTGGCFAGRISQMC